MDLVVVIFPLIRWYYGELHTVSCLHVLVVVHWANLVVIMAVMDCALLY